MSYPMHSSSKSANQTAEPNSPNSAALEYSANLFKTLANSHRLLILLLLRQKGKLNVRHIQDALNISQPLASQHIKTLKQNGLLTEQRQGKHVYYGLKTAAISNALLNFIQVQALELTSEAETVASLNELITFCCNNV